MAVTLTNDQVSALKQMVDVDLKANGIRSFYGAVDLLRLLSTPVSSDDNGSTFEPTQEQLQRIDGVIDSVLKSLGVQVVDTVLNVVNAFNVPAPQPTAPAADIVEAPAQN